MGKRGRFKKPKINNSRFHVKEAPDYDDMPPVFSLERIQASSKYCLSKLEKKYQAAFATSIFKRRNIKWKEITQIDRHTLGSEKIPKSAIKTGVPNFITDEIDSFLVFRFYKLMPMVGYRQKNVFYVLWFDHDFSLYDHG